MLAGYHVNGVRSGGSGYLGTGKQKRVKIEVLVALVLAEMVSE